MFAIMSNNTFIGAKNRLSTPLYWRKQCLSACYIRL
jgi:hypothetical protein